MHDLAEGSPFRFEFDRVTPEQWNQASAMSRPDLDKHVPDPTSLVPIFHAISVEKPAPAADPLATSRAVISASYHQRSPKEATRAPARAASSRPRRVAAAPATCPTVSRQEGSRNDEKVRRACRGQGEFERWLL